MTSFGSLADHARDEPVVSSLPPLADFYLDEIDVYPSVDAFERDLYNPNYQFETDVIIDTDTRHPDYPRVECTADPVTPDLNEVVDWARQSHHERLRQELLPQSDIKHHILESVTTEDLVALVVVDGLSYDAVRNLEWEMQPVVVDGVTTTEPGFRRVIYGGNTRSVHTALLNEKEFYDPYGFTYWEDGQEPLSTDLHATMPVERISDFDEALTTLTAEAPLSGRTYVQITRMGFDQHCHNRKEEPNRDAIRADLVGDLQALAQTAGEIADEYRIFVTADHGIVWRDQLPDESCIVQDEWEDHVRFVDGARDLPHSRVEQTGAGDVATGLAYPYQTREFKNTEWGGHGGFSYYESIVPLIELDNTGDST